MSNVSKSHGYSQWFDQGIINFLTRSLQNWNNTSFDWQTKAIGTHEYLVSAIVYRNTQFGLRINWFSSNIGFVALKLAF